MKFYYCPVPHKCCTTQMSTGLWKEECQRNVGPRSRDSYFSQNASHLWLFLCRSGRKCSWQKSAEQTCTLHLSIIAAEIKIFCWNLHFLPSSLASKTFIISLLNTHAFAREIIGQVQFPVGGFQEKFIRSFADFKAAEGLFALLTFYLWHWTNIEEIW